MRKLIQFLFIAVVLFLVEYFLINQAAILFLVTSGLIQLCGLIIVIRLLLFDQRNTSQKSPGLRLFSFYLYLERLVTLCLVEIQQLENSAQLK